MTMSPVVLDRERDKFLETGAGETAVRVNAISMFSVNVPENADSFDVQYPDAVTEIYRYFLGGISGTLLKTITIIYTNAAHDGLVSFEIT